MKKKYFIFAAVAAVLINMIPIPVHADDVSDDTAKRIYATLIEEGYSHAGACGILGNVAVENPQFDPNLESADGNYYGLFQWSNVGERRSNLIKYCRSRLLKHNLITGQLAFAFHELRGGDSIASRIDSYLRETDDVAEAAMEFAAGFERCIGKTSNADNDGIYTGTIYPEHYNRTYQALNLRIEKANYYDNLFRELPLDNKLQFEIVEKPSILSRVITFLAILIGAVGIYILIRFMPRRYRRVIIRIIIRIRKAFRNDKL